MVWAWMLWSGDRVLLEHERNYGLGMDALVIVCSFGTRTKYGLGIDALVTVCMLLKHERNCGLGMDALVW